MMPFKIAVFDSQSYDISSFKKCLSATRLENEIDLHFIHEKCNPATIGHYTQGYGAICVFVNDNVNEKVVRHLHQHGIKLILCRCAGFDMIDINTCQSLGISVVRVPAYSPYAVAEFASALLLTLNRKLHKAYNRVRDGDFSLSGLVGFDIHGKTVGVVGTGKIGRCFANIAIGFGKNV